MNGISLYQNQITQSGQGSRNTISENVNQSKNTSGVRQEITALQKGTVFEGVITETRDGYATLSLTNGQSIKAQLESGVNIKKGMPVLFEVKSNQNNQIVIRQLPIQSQFNPTLQKALTTAGLPLTERNLAMVNEMMQKQMPIDKGNLTAMARMVQSHSQAAVETLIQMKKLGFTITETSIQQFEGYKSGNHALVDRFSQMMNELPEIFGNAENHSDAGSVVSAEKMIALQNGVLETLELGKEQITGGQNQATGTLENILTAEGRENLIEQLRQLSGMEENSKLFTEGELNTKLSAKEVLLEIQKTLEQFGTKDAPALKELFQGKEYKSLLKQVMSEQWLLEPEQVGNKENVEKLYESLNRQMEKLEQFLQNAQKETPALQKDVSNVRSNLEMMNQMNQLYNYIQLPLKLKNQNAHSDLYVYTNKKKLSDRKGELSAFLHLELENLGTTDVQIKMLGSNVTTNFYLSDDISYKIIEQHMEELQERLQEKGYSCNIRLEKRVKEIDFVQDFLEKELPVGKLQRYSFDVLT